MSADAEQRVATYTVDVQTLDGDHHEYEVKGSAGYTKMSGWVTFTDVAGTVLAEFAAPVVVAIVREPVDPAD